MKIDKKKFKEAILTELKNRFGKRIENANQREIFDSVSFAVMGLIQDNWIAPREKYEKDEVKQAYYLSAEFLMGRALGNNLVNLTVFDDVKEVLTELGCDINTVEDAEIRRGSRQRRSRPSRRLLPRLPRHPRTSRTRLRHPVPLRHLRTEDRERIPGRISRQVASIRRSLVDQAARRVRFRPVRRTCRRRTRRVRQGHLPYRGRRSHQGYPVRYAHRRLRRE